MSKREIERTVQPSLLDRLTDHEPRNASSEGRVGYLDSVRQFKAGLQRDLEWLLNTRRIPVAAPEVLICWSAWPATIETRAPRPTPIASAWTSASSVRSSWRPPRSRTSWLKVRGHSR